MCIFHRLNLTSALSWTQWYEGPIDSFLYFLTGAHQARAVCEYTAFELPQTRKQATRRTESMLLAHKHDADKVGPWRDFSGMVSWSACSW